MGLFKTKNISLEKVVKEDTIQYFIDYHKIKDPDVFLLNFILEMAEDKNLLLVIDTNYFYEKSHLVSENKITELKKVLDDEGLAYRVVVTKKEAENKVFGIKIQKSEKINTYQIGLAVTQGQLRGVAGIFKDCNIFYYVMNTSTDTGEMINQFYDIHGDYEEMDNLCSFHIYNDCYFQRLRINSKQDITGSIESKVAKYQG